MASAVDATARRARMVRCGILAASSLETPAEALAEIGLVASTALAETRAAGVDGWAGDDPDRAEALLAEQRMLQVVLDIVGSHDARTCCPEEQRRAVSQLTTALVP